MPRAAVKLLLQFVVTGGISDHLLEDKDPSPILLVSFFFLVVRAEHTYHEEAFILLLELLFWVQVTR